MGKSKSYYRQQRDELFKETGRVCFLGGEISRKNKLTGHHMVPKSAGGSNKKYNLAALCRLEHDIIHMLDWHNRRAREELHGGMRDFKRTLDKDIISDMEAYAWELVERYDYQVEDRGKILVLKRRLSL